jgi:stearoyl-CoA desaturase (delta-9 desaturase)
MIKLLTIFSISFFTLKYFLETYVGVFGIVGNVFEDGAWWKYLIYMSAMTHITITCMSLSFHRFHTHKGVIFNKYFDGAMQMWLWAVTSMGKSDWVSVHTYHHAFSDTEKDPHSPVHKGLWRVFFGGSFDYASAKSWPEVLKIRKTIKENKLERFMGAHPFVGPFILTALLITMFGIKWGSILSITNFLIGPVFAVGGVNALAHYFGYRNHIYDDNSRNIGFLFPLNFLICGELDHNNHHAHQKSCSFRHQWYEFDIGYAYILMLEKVGLAEKKNVYDCKKLKIDLSHDLRKVIEKDYKLKARLEQLAGELNTSFQELLQMIEDYVRGEKVKLNDNVKELIADAKRTFWANAKIKLQYN